MRLKRIKLGSSKHSPEVPVNSIVSIERNGDKVKVVCVKRTMLGQMITVRKEEYELSADIKDVLLRVALDIRMVKISHRCFVNTAYITQLNSKMIYIKVFAEYKHIGKSQRGAINNLLATMASISWLEYVNPLTAHS